MKSQRRRSTARPGPGHITLARAISKHGAASRSQAKVLIEGNRVSVNGTTARNADRWVDPRVDRIQIDGAPLRKREFVYLAMHKPAGIVTTRSDERGRQTVYALLPLDTPWVFPIGRLDKESSGLLLLTNDTRFGERITGPDQKVPKTYRVQVERPLSDHDARIIEKGMTVGGTHYRALRVDVSAPDRTACLIVLTEGKNREIRRMFDHLGNRVVSLHREGIGPLLLGKLRTGAVRPLSPSEVRALKSSYSTEDRK